MDSFSASFKSSGHLLTRMTSALRAPGLRFPQVSCGKDLILPRTTFHSSSIRYRILPNSPVLKGVIQKYNLRRVTRFNQGGNSMHPVLIHSHPDTVKLFKKLVGFVADHFSAGTFSPPDKSPRFSSVAPAQDAKFKIILQQGAPNTRSSASCRCLPHLDCQLRSRVCRKRRI